MDRTLLLLTSSHFGALDVTLQKQVYREFYTLVYRAILYSVNDHYIAEDIIQEAFLKVIRNIPPIKNEMELRAWIKVVARNTTYNYLRKNKRNRNLNDSDSVFIENNPQLSTAADMIENEIQLKTMSEAIGKLLQQLKPEYRILVEMRWQQELSYKEIAEALQISEETVKSKLHRAREAIKKQFTSEWGDENEQR